MKICERKLIRKKRLIGYIAGSCILVLLLGTFLGMGTYAWISNMRETTGSMTVYTSGTDLFIGDVLIYTSSGVMRDGSINMKSYDTIRGKNDETPFYVFLPIRGKAIEQGKDIRLFIEYSNPLLNESGKVYNTISNMLNVKGKVVSQEPANFSSSRGLFKGEGTPNWIWDSDGRSFAHYDVLEDHSVKQPATKNPLEAILSGYSQGESLYILLEFSYADELIKNYLLNQFGKYSVRLGESNERIINGEDFYISLELVE